MEVGHWRWFDLTEKIFPTKIGQIGRVFKVEDILRIGCYGCYCFFSILYSYSYMIYRNWKVDATVPTYWFIRILVTIDDWCIELEVFVGFCWIWRAPMTPLKKDQDGDFSRSAEQIALTNECVSNGFNTKHNDLILSEKPYWETFKAEASPLFEMAVRWNMLYGNLDCEETAETHEI